MHNFDRYDHLDAESETGTDFAHSGRTAVGDDYVILWWHDTEQIDQEDDFATFHGPFYRIEVHTENQKPNWNPLFDAQVPESLRPQFDGLGPTTILFRGEPYGVSAIKSLVGGWLYTLVPWPSGQAMGRTVDYSRLAESLRQTYEEELTWASVSFYIFHILRSVAGQLPRGVLEILSLRFPIRVGGALRSGLFLAIITGLVLVSAHQADTWREYFSFLNETATKPEPVVASWVMNLGILVLLDGFLRLMLSQTSIGLRGNLALELLWWILGGWFKDGSEASNSR